MQRLSIRSRDGVEQVEVDGDHITVPQLKTLIEKQLQIPVQSQTLSTNRNLLFAETPSDILALSDMADPNLRINSELLDYGCVVYLAYEGERGGLAVTPAASVDDQMRVSRQDKSHCDSVSLDRACLNAFGQYVKESPVKRGGFMYGTVSHDGQVKVDFIYEPKQCVYEDHLILQEDPYEVRCADAIALGLGMRKVGFIFNQTKEYTLSNGDVLLASSLQGMSDLKEWATAVVKLGTSEDGGDHVQTEAFQMSDICVRLYREGWFETEEITPDDDPKLSRMTKEVLVGAERLKLVDNDLFLVKTNKILEHKGLLSCAFQIENRNTPALVWHLKARMNGASNLPFAKRISDFHLLLFASKFLQYTSQVTALADCVRLQSRDPKKYELLINTLGVNPC